jgi:hypothetical protein
LCIGDFGTPKSGQTVEICHLRSDVVARLVDGLAIDPDPDELVMNLLSGIADGVPLHGTDLLTGYRDAVRTLPPAHAAAELHSLVLETYDLVEEHVPELEPGEVDRWRHHFHYRRPFWETAPPRP